jgi:hypothetical protein
MISDLHPLAVPFPPLQRVGLFAAASVRALADFAALNAAAHECVTQMGVRDRALPGALQCDIAMRADSAAVKCAISCEALADALVPAARQLGISPIAIEILIAFRDVSHLPPSWTLASPLMAWRGVGLSDFGLIIFLPYAQLTGSVDFARLPPTLYKLVLPDNALVGTPDLTRLPPSLMELDLGYNSLSGAVSLASLPATLTHLRLRCLPKVTGTWRGEKPRRFEFEYTGIEVVAENDARNCLIA